MRYTVSVLETTEGREGTEKSTPQRHGDAEKSPFVFLF